MSQVQLLDFAAEPILNDLSFPDLENRFGVYLENARSVSELNDLVRSVKPLFRSERYCADELRKLRRLRQRAYDRRRSFKCQASVAESPFRKQAILSRSGRSARSEEKPMNRQKLIIAKESKASDMAPDAQIHRNTKAMKETFVEGAFRTVSSIDGERFVKAAPKALLWLSASILVSFFLWEQSITLYESADFSNAIHSAAGGILMIVGFAAYQATARSWLALILCIYAGAYEGFLMISGTLNNEKIIQTEKTDASPELIFLKEQASRENAKYLQLKQRYDNPDSKVFKNEWFLKKYLEPAWVTNAKAHQDLIAKKEALKENTKASHVIWLKILYRLGLVFLCMVLVHRFFACWRTISSRMKALMPQNC